MKNKFHLILRKETHLFFLCVINILFVGYIAFSQAPQIAHAQIVGCGDAGDPGNADGVGKYCTQGGGQCLGTGAPICSADIESGVPGVCSKPCSTDADCGTGAVCLASSLGSGCEPIACETSPSPTPSSAPTATSTPAVSPPSTVAPTNGCLGAGCAPSPTIAPTQPISPTVTTAPTSGTGGLSGLLQLLLQFIQQLIKLILSIL